MLVRVSVGGPERDRTADLLIANEALSQLSYRHHARGKGPFGRPYQVGAIYGQGWGESRIGRCKPVLAACLAAVDPLVSPRSAKAKSQAKHPPMRAILDVILIVLDLYIWLLIAAAVLSWLVAFNVVNSRNQFVAMVGDFLFRITEPVLRPVRNMLPSLGGIDVSPVVVILIIILIKDVIVRYIYPAVF